MIPINNILVPVDFSEKSEYALGQAIAFAKTSNSKLILFNAYHRPMVPSGVEVEVEKSFLKKRARSIDKKFDDLIQNCPELKDVEFTTRKMLGKSTDSIVAAIKPMDIDLVIMASKGAHGFDEIWGSKSAKVAMRAKCPVLVLPDRADIGNLNNIGFACDFKNKIDSEMLNILPLLAKIYNVKIHVINVTLSAKDTYAKKHKDPIKLHHLLEEVPHSFDYIYNRDVEYGLIKYCKDNDIGLLAIMPKSRNFFEKLFRESLTEQMVYHIDIPLLVLK